ncbi:MAG: ribosome maturation factor RimM [Candidatus Flexifilum sp.]|jgi:16S rRNA processing protein RimM
MTTRKSDNTPRYLLIAEVMRPHGIRGEVKVKLLTDYPERIPQLAVVYLGRSENATAVRALHVEAMRMHQGFGLIKFKEIADRSAAERLRGQFLMVGIEDAVPLEADEFYLFELIDLEVLTTDGAHFGVLVEVLETGANDVYIIDSPDYGEVLIPAVPDYVLETNVREGYLIARIPPELLPDRPAPRDDADDRPEA